MQVRDALLLHRLALALGLLCTLTPHETWGINYAWKAAVPGDWSDRTRWNPEGTPGPFDNVTIAAAGVPYTITVSGSAVARTLTVSSPDLTLHMVAPSQLQVGQPFNNGTTIDGDANQVISCTIKAPIINNLATGVLRGCSVSGNVVNDGVIESCTLNKGAATYTNNASIKTSVIAGAGWTFNQDAGHAEIITTAAHGTIMVAGGVFQVERIDSCDVTVGGGTFYPYFFDSGSLRFTPSAAGDLALNLNSCVLSGHIPAGINLAFGTWLPLGQITAPAGVTNYGTVKLRNDRAPLPGQPDEFFLIQLQVPSGTLVNDAGGAISTEGTADRRAEVSAEVVNHGNLAFLAIGKPEAFHDNYGTMHLVSVSGRSFTNHADASIESDAAAVDEFYNYGTVRPCAASGAHGMLGVSGNYHQGLNSTLEIEIGSRTSYDQLSVGGYAWLLGGRMLVLLRDGFIPQPGDEFQVLRFGSLLSPFGEMVLPELDNRLRFIPKYDAISLWLRVEKTRDLDGDQDVDEDDVKHFQSCSSRAGVSATSACGGADFDNDGDADQDDFGLLQRCFSGAGNKYPPSCVN